MKKIALRTYVLIFIAVLALMSIPKASTEKLKGGMAAIFSPLWHMLKNPSLKNADSNASQENLQRLQLENALLSSELVHIKETMKHELKLIAQSDFAKNSVEQKNIMSFMQRRYQRDLQKAANKHLKLVPAQVIFRSPTSWSSSFWIDVGTTANEELNKHVVAKNSPVMVGNAVVGVIDYAGKSQSRVRLITDSGLTPSVRVSRGAAQDDFLRDKIDNLIQALDKKSSVPLDPKEQKELLQLLHKANNALTTSRPSWLLAKGELHGASKPLWRTQGMVLKGIGFNYDFDDEEGPARDLRTGKPVDPASKDPVMPLMQQHDLLVTTGMDGVFPPGLLVAEVTEVRLLKEGDYYYELEAVPAAGNMDDLSLVFVLPPLGYDPDEQPPPIGHSW